MFIVLLRHGIAEDKGTKPDDERELTEVGHKRMKQIARGLARLFPKAEGIISSPLARATWKCGWRARLRRRSSRLDAVAPAVLACAGIASPATSMPMIVSVLPLSSAFFASSWRCCPPKNVGGFALCAPSR